MLDHSIMLAKLKELELKNVIPTGKVLGKGSFGKVIEVLWSNSTCAAKEFHNIFSRGTDHEGRQFDKVIENFQRECRTWSALKHPNIVQFFGVCKSDTRTFSIVLEKMDISLRQYLERHKQRSEILLSDKAFILCQVVSGLYYLHHLDPPLVHHDLTPNNILLNLVTLQTKLTDFGVTRALIPLHQTLSSSVIKKGSPTCMAPEALDDPTHYDCKLDIFSFGNCVLATLTHVVWPGPTFTSSEGVVLRTEFEFRTNQIDLMSQAEKDLFLSLIETCLSNAPQQRPDSAELVAKMTQISLEVGKEGSPSAYSPCETQKEEVLSTHHQITRRIRSLLAINNQLRLENSKLTEINEQLLSRSNPVEQTLLLVSGSEPDTSAEFSTSELSDQV